MDKFLVYSNINLKYSLLVLFERPLCELQVLGMWGVSVKVAIIKKKVDIFYLGGGVTL